jgi:hypothetical protein
MTAGVRARRLEREWELLAALADHNPGILEVVGRESQPESEVFRVILHRTSALSLTKPPRVMESASHRAWFRYPAYFPSVPIEGFLDKPVFHPNIHPENGFVCLWSRFSVGDTIIEALRQLQRIVTWELWNDRAEHVMQPEALRWERGVLLPLSCEKLCVPAELLFERACAHKWPRTRINRLAP